MRGGTELGRVRGLGSARRGAKAFLVQRGTAFAQLFLMPWLLASLVLRPSVDHKAVTEWLGSPVNAVLLMLLVVSVFTHLRLGLKELVEDYVHDEPLKIASLLIVNAYAIAGGALALFSILRIALSGSAA